MLKYIWFSGSWDFNPDTSEAMVNINWYTLVWEEVWEQSNSEDWIKLSVQNAENVAENEKHLKKTGGSHGGYACVINSEDEQACPKKNPIYSCLPKGLYSETFIGNGSHKFTYYWIGNVSDKLIILAW